MKNNLKIVLLSLALLMITPAITFAEDALLEPQISGKIEGTGSYFEITDSEYLNISLQSTEEITIDLESTPRMISLDISSSTDFTSTDLTISGLEPYKTYYKYEDSYKNKAVFVSNENGNYSFVQDLTQPHHIWIQETPGTIFMPEDCDTYGIWNTTTSTCTLNQDLYESVEITENNITLDCAGHSITGADTGTGYGVYVNRKINIAVKNCTINNFGVGIRLVASDNNVISENSVSNNSTGIGLSNSDNNSLINNTANLNSCGIYLHYSNDNTIDSNIFSENSSNGISLFISQYNIFNSNSILNNKFGVYLYASGGTTMSSNIISNNQYNFGVYATGEYDFAFQNTIDTSNTVDGKPIYYLRNVTNQVYDSSTNAGVFYCINCDNITVKDLVLDKNISGIFFWKTNNSRIENITISNSINGIQIYYSNYNILIENNISFNGKGIYFYSSDGNKIFHNNFTDNTIQVLNYDSYSSFLDNGYPIDFDLSIHGGNYWNDYTGIDEKSGSNQDQPGSDGIGDTRHYVKHDNSDRYPFMTESGWEAPQSSIYNVAVILAEPSNVPHEASEITEQPCKFISEKTYPNGHNEEYYRDLTDCVTDYHRENSFGTVNLDFKIFDNNGDWFEVIQEGDFIKEAVNLVISQGIDLFDKDIIIVVRAGKNKDGFQRVIIDDLTGEVIEFSNIKVGESSPVGVWAHEIGHFIGSSITPKNTSTPDMYKMGDVGKWDLMADGSWNGGLIDVLPIKGNGSNPCNMSSFTKEFLQWLNYDIHPKSAYGEYWINSLETCNLGDNVFRYNLSNDTNDESEKYYILEARNRDLKTWDSSLPGLTSKHLILYYVDSMGFPKYGYNLDKRKIAAEDWTITIPGHNPVNPLAFITDGVLNPSGSIYRDIDNLVKFTAVTDRTANDKYEIQAKIEEITNNSFFDKFWGVILKPDSLFREKIKGDFIFENSPNFSITQQSPIYQKGQTSITKKSPPRYSKEYSRRVAEGIFWWMLFPLLLLSSLILTNKIIFKGKIKSVNTFKKILIISFLCGIFFCVWFFLTQSRINFLWLLFVLFLLNFFLRLLNKKIIPDKNKEKRLIKIFSKIIWVLIIFVSIGIIVLFAYSFTQESELDHEGVQIRIINTKEKSSPQTPTTLPDIDLHLYCDDGKHIGMNYETGEYEIGISEAIVSGDNQDAPEWIFIPPEIENCHFVVSSYDNQKFLEENPEIAQEMEDTTDSYEIYARYIDPETAIYTSDVISEEQIEPGQELEQPITGTTDIAVLHAIPWQTPKLLKEQSISLLEGSKTNDKGINREIDSIIRHIDKSLDNALWIDDFRLDSKQGRRVLSEQSFAVSRLYHKARIFNTKISILKRIIEIKQRFGLDTKKEETEIEAVKTILPVFNQVTGNLIKADRIIAETAINDAKNAPVENPRFQDTVDRFIEKAERELLRAEKEMSKARPDKAVMRLSQSWSYAQLAVKFAAPPFFKSHTTGLHTRFLGALYSFFHPFW